MRMLPRPLGDRAGAGDHLAVVEHEDRHLVGAAEPLDLLAVGTAAAPGPGHSAVALDGLQLVLVAGRVERLAGLGAGVGEAGPMRLLAAGVEDHGSDPSAGLRAARRSRARR